MKTSYIVSSHTNHSKIYGITIHKYIDHTKGITFPQKEFSNGCIY